MTIREPVPEDETEGGRIEAVDAIHDRLKEGVDPPDEVTLESVWSVRRAVPEAER